MNSHSKPKQDAVLVCVDETKCIDKYVPLGDVILGGKPLKIVLAEKDARIIALENNVTRLSEALQAIGLLAVETAGKDLPNEKDSVH